MIYLMVNTTPPPPAEKQQVLMTLVLTVSVSLMWFIIVFSADTWQQIIIVLQVFLVKTN